MVTIKISGAITINDYKDIYDWWGMECTTPKMLQDALEKAGGEDITLVINSGGGVCVAAFEMVQDLKNYKGNIEVNVIYAASAATLIACAGNKTLVAKASVYMIHNSQGRAEGDYRDLGDEANALQQFNESIINIYEDKTGLTRDEIQKLMDENTYMAPQRAIELGFADGFIDENNDELNWVAAAAGVPVITPERAAEIRELIKNEENSAITVSNNQTKKGATEMTLEELLQQNAEARAEYDAAIKKAKNEGKEEAKAENAEAIENAVADERKRLQDLDAIAGNVTEEALNEAKYGDEPTDAKTLAFKAMTENNMLAANYMKNAVADSTASGVTGVNSTPDEDDEVDASDEMAGYINSRKRGKKNGRTAK